MTVMHCIRRPRSIGPLGRMATLVTALSALPIAVHPAETAEAAPSEVPIEQQVQSLVPDLEAYVDANMKAFDVPGLAIGIVAGDDLVYAKGFGVRSKGGAAVDTGTVFQIGSTSKAFLSATMAIAVDRGHISWDDRVVDLHPEFQMYDPWVTREFRVFDLLAQRSGLPPYANDPLGLLGLDRSALVRSLRSVEPVSSFRSTFAYTNITHILAGNIVAEAEGAADWQAVLQSEILDPLGMNDTSYTAAAISAAADHAEGYRYTPDGSVEVPFVELSPYEYDGAGAINSSIEDMAKWVSLQLAGGTTPDGHRLVSAENLAYTHTPKVAMNATTSYALGWAVRQTPNGSIIFHDGGTYSFGAMVVLQPDRKLGVVVLSNQTNVGMPDAVGLWAMDRLLGNPMVDHGAAALARARTGYADDLKHFARPPEPQPSPSLAPLVGNFSHPGIGEAVLEIDGDDTLLEVVATGARLHLDPWDGAVYTATLLPDAGFASIVANLNPLPLAFAQFQSGDDGMLNTLRLTFFDGEAYDLTRKEQ
jgi:CubicO group peptidase (beta-lactamase class C family)